MNSPETINGITLINGDCLEYMRSLPDKAFTLAIVDPPYGDALQSTDGGGYNRFGGRFDRYKDIKKKDSVGRTDGTWASKYGRKIIGWDKAPSQEYFDELFRVSEDQIVWGANYFRMPPTRCFIVWKKTNIPEKFTMAMCEYAWTSFNANAKVFEYTSLGDKNDPRFHATQKPVALYKWLLKNYAKEGDTILDTHGGSMSSMIACMDGHFTATCIELDPNYFEKAKARIIEHSKQSTLF